MHYDLLNMRIGSFTLIYKICLKQINAKLLISIIRIEEFLNVRKKLKSFKNFIDIAPCALKEID